MTDPLSQIATRVAYGRDNGVERGLRATGGVFIVAQGLLMYLAPESVRQLFASIADRFPGSELVFDTVPRWFSGLTSLGLNQTAVSARLPWQVLKVGSRRRGSRGRV
jgi:O-methyltransferase involved in polyketide biosynthesis